MVLDIGDLPVWRGVQDEPGFVTLPFKLGIDHGLIRLRLSPSELRRITEEYSRDTYGFITSPPGTSEWGTRLGDWYFELLAKQVGRLIGKTVLEIGSGSLHIAERVVNELGAAHFTACDPALRPESRLKDIEVVREYFTGSLFDRKHFDLVLSINTLEHIPDPFEHLVDIRRLLETRNGAIYVVVPDCSRGLRMGDPGICIHEHLSYFTPETLESGLRSSGFAAYWLYTEDDTIFALARPAVTVSKQDDSFRVSTQFLEAFESRFRDNLEAIQQLIANKATTRLGIHGCSVGLNNLFGLLGIASNTNIYLFDGDSRKVGKFLPTFNRPIKASTDSSYRTVEAVIVAALTYYDEIRNFVVNNHDILPSQVYPIIPFEEC